MNAKLSKQLFLYNMNKLNQTDTLEMFKELVETGQIWQCPTKMVDSAAVLLASGHFTVQKKGETG